MKRDRKGKFCNPMTGSTKNEILKLFTEDLLSIQKIAHKVGFSHPIVTRTLKNAGVDVREVQKRRASLFRKGKYFGKRGSEHPQWSGGTTVDANGYVRIQSGNKQVYQHRQVMEQYIGRPLKKNEVVHHIDGDKTNNNISNLEILIKSQHDKHEATRRHILKQFPQDRGETKRGMESPCHQCGKPVYSNKSRTRIGRGKYCSRICFYTAMKR